jgi:hypothetical protein
MGSVRFRIDTAIFFPLFLVLTLAACLNAYQVYAPLHEGPQTLHLFARILGSRLVYCWYFLVLAAVVQRNSRIIVLTRPTAARWAALHCLVLIASFFVHEALMFGVESLLFVQHRPSAIFFMLFNNPAVWIEAFVYVILLLFFSLLEYRKISRENELAIAELEAGLARTTLRELRNQIQPEFLFTTLETIHMLVRKGRNADANHILALLSDFLRTTVYDTNRSEAVAAEEPGILGRDIEIETLRTRQLQSVRDEIERIVHEH